MSKKFKALICVFIGVALVAGAAAAVVAVQKSRPTDEPVTAEVLEQYPAVPADAHVQPIPSEAPQETPQAQEGSGASVSLTYSTAVTAASGQGPASILFQNPSRSNQNMVLEIQITDDELLSKLGKTGRTAQEQAKLDANEGYDPALSRVIVARSGAIEPGMMLDTIELQALPDGTVLPQGEYNGVFYVLFYDVLTNERAIVNTQIPVTISVGG